MSLKEKIPADILFFCYNLSPALFAKKIQELQFDTEVKQVMTEYVQKMNASLGVAGQMPMGPGPTQDQVGDLAVNSMMDGYA